MNHDEPTLKDVARDTIGRLAAFRDDVRVRLHLAGMEANDLWKKIEPAVLTLEKRLEGALDRSVPGGSEQIRLELHLGLAEARDRVHELESKAHSLGEALTERGRGALAKLKHDLARIQPPFD